MSTMNISLPEKLRSYVEERVEAGDYSSASEYIRELVRVDRVRRDQEKLEAMLLEGLQSGDGIEVTPELWQEIRREVKERIERKKAA